MASLIIIIGMDNNDYVIILESSVRKQKLDEALLNMVVKDLVPSHIVEETSFIKIVELLDPK